MNICFIQHTLLNRGGDKMVVEYANYLQSVGHDVVIVTNRIDTVYDVQVPTHFLSHGKSKFSTILHALFKKREHDVIIPSIVVMVLFLSMRNHRRLIYFAQDYDATYYENPFMKLFIDMIYFYCLRIRKIPVIAVSEQLGLFLEKKFKANVKVAANGVDARVFYPDRDDHLLALKGAKKVILIHGRRDYRKGPDVAEEVIRLFEDELEQDRIAVWAVGEHISDRAGIKNFGYVQPDQLRKILSCSDALFYPSRHEGFGLFVLESMACGCPVITTDAVPFAVHEVSSLLCNTDDIGGCVAALQRILYDELLAKKIILNGLSVARQWSLSVSKKNFEDAILSYKES